MPQRQDIDSTSSPAVAPAALLLVDDDRLARFSTAVALRARGFSVDECDGAAAALARLESVQPDVMLVDAMMPGIDGFELTRRVRAMPYCTDLPILMLTALDDDETIARAFDAGATDFLTKSLRWSLLEARLRFLLRGSAARREAISGQVKLLRAQRIARLGSFAWDLRARCFVEAHGCASVLGIDVPMERVPFPELLCMIHPDERGLVVSRADDAIRRGLPLKLEFRIRPVAGPMRVLRVVGEVERGEDGEPSMVHGVVQDVTERRLAEEKIRQLANYDPLTGLPNRRAFMARCERVIAAAGQAGPVAALTIDVDRFKHVNDTLGHAAGDDLLTEVSRRLRAVLRECADLFQPSGPLDEPAREAASPMLARLGADEFAMLLPALQSESVACRVAQRVVDALREPMHMAGEQVYPTVSIGMALHPRDGSDVSALLAHADVALQAVKARGGASFGDSASGLAPSGRARLELERSLARAIARDELLLHWQPQVAQPHGEILGAEALIRWHRAGRVVPPDEFLPLAEQTGLIVPIGEWAVREACRQLHAWRDAGCAPATVSVNIASQHFEQASLVDTARDAMQRHGLPAGALELEITETGVMRDITRALPTLEALRAAGVRLAIDDFGTGYSSLAYLTQLPIQVLKIDRSFVKDLGRSRSSEAVVATVMALARALRLRVVAEGVESDEQLVRLRNLGCDAVQGFLFARPMPADEWPGFVAQRRLS